MEEKDRCRWILNEYGYIDLSQRQDFDCPVPKNVKGFWLAYDEEKEKPVKKHRKKVKKMETTTQEIAHVETSTMGSISVPVEPIVVPEPPKADVMLTMLVGAVSGALPTILMRMLKKKDHPKKVEAPKQEEKHTACKTHNMKCETRSKHLQEEIQKLNDRIDSLEGTMEISPDFGGDLKDLRERIEKLEGKKKKK